MNMIKKMICCLLALLLIPILFACQKKELTKEDIIQSFKDNTDRFIEIQNYAEETDWNLYVANGYGIKIENVDETTGKSIDVDDEKIVKQINWLANKFSILSIMEYDGNVEFKYTAGGIKGIIYLKNNAIPDSITNCERIGDHWYYYESLNV